MPDDVRGEKVENFRLTKDQLSFQKKVKTANQIKLALDMKMNQLKEESKGLRMLYDALEQGMQGIQIPEEGMRDLPGMDFGAEETQEAEGVRPSPEKFQMNY